MEENKIKEKLEKEVMLIANEINNLEYENISKFLENTKDILLITPLGLSESVGFNIVIKTGDIGIMFIYYKNSAFVLGFWGDAEFSKSVDIKKADMILQYLNEMTKIAKEGSL